MTPSAYTFVTPKAYTKALPKVLVSKDLGLAPPYPLMPIVYYPLGVSAVLPLYEIESYWGD